MVPGPWFWLSYCPQMHVAHDPLISTLNPMCPFVTHGNIEHKRTYKLKHAPLSPRFILE